MVPQSLRTLDGMAKAGGLKSLEIHNRIQYNTHTFASSVAVLFPVLLLSNIMNENELLRSTSPIPDLL